VACLCLTQLKCSVNQYPEVVVEVHGHFFHVVVAFNLSSTFFDLGEENICCFRINLFIDVD
jgi:hypothetical protein